MQTVLITGGSGFIGFNFIPHFLDTNQELKIVNLDILANSRDFLNLKVVKENPI
jgi:dTDP-glucose 4,6-dehydratase